MCVLSLASPIILDMTTKTLKQRPTPVHTHVVPSLYSLYCIWTYFTCEVFVIYITFPFMYPMTHIHTHTGTESSPKSSMTQIQISFLATAMLCADSQQSQKHHHPCYWYIVPRALIYALKIFHQKIPLPAATLLCFHKQLRTGIDCATRARRDH